MVKIGDAFNNHTGGPCPVDPATPVRPVYRGNADPAKGTRIFFAPAARLDWSHDGGPDDIVGYFIETASSPPTPAKPDPSLLRSAPTRLARHILGIDRHR